MNKSDIISNDTTVSDTPSLLWSCYCQLDCQHLFLFEYCPDQNVEWILDCDICPLGVMKAWEEGTGYQIVVELVKRPLVPHAAIN